MSGRIARGWSMAKASFAILRQYPKLALLPVASGTTLLAAVGIMVLLTLPKSAPLHATATALMARFGTDTWSYVPVFALGFVAIYLLTAISIFFNAALVHCAMRCHASETPSLRGGLSMAGGNLRAILGWAFIATTVGILLNAIEGALKETGIGNVLASVIGGLLNIAWSVTTYFVLPVLVVERLGPIAAVRRSAQVLRAKWGEMATGEIGFGLIGLLFFSQAALLFFAGLAIVFLKGATAYAAAGPVLMGAGVILALVTMIVMQTLSTIFQAGVYVYATSGQVPASLEGAAIENAFRPKK